MRIRPLALAFLLIAVATVALGYRNALAGATVRHLAVHVAGWPTATPPVRLVLLSDIHVVEPDMPPARLASLVERVNALRPECVLIAGDLVSDRLLATRHVPFGEALAPLAALRPRLATIAVLGNHDHWRDGRAAAAALRRNRVQVLANTAIRCGALAIGGVDDSFKGRADVPATEAAMRKLGGIPVVLSHSPDVFPQATTAGLTLAGHTHCGQIALPFVGPLVVPSRFGKRYPCGLVRERGRSLVVTACIGTSILPLRFGAPPDLWVVTLGAAPTAIVRQTT